MEGAGPSRGPRPDPLFFCPPPPGEDATGAAKASAMRCPLCGSPDSKVVDSRDIDGSVRRRRECLTCKHRFTTYERIEQQAFYVVKKDGRREEFSKAKLLAGV